MRNNEPQSLKRSASQHPKRSKLSSLLKFQHRHHGNFVFWAFCWSLLSTPFKIFKVINPTPNLYFYNKIHTSCRIPPRPVPGVDVWLLAAKAPKIPWNNLQRAAPSPELSTWRRIFPLRVGIEYWVLSFTARKKWVFGKKNIFYSILFHYALWFLGVFWHTSETNHRRNCWDPGNLADRSASSGGSGGRDWSQQGECLMMSFIWKYVWHDTHDTRSNLEKSLDSLQNEWLFWYNLEIHFNTSMSWWNL